MKIHLTLYFAVLFLLVGCYSSEDDLTSIEAIEINLLEAEDDILADGFSTYHFVIKLPGIKYGESKETSVKSSWGTWNNDSSSATFFIEYNSLENIYIDTIQLKAGRIPGPFAIEISEGAKHIRTIDLSATPQYPSIVQILSDSIKLQLSPGNNTKVKALFFNESGFPSYGTKFRFKTEASVNIYPRDLILGSTETTATVQISIDTKPDTIKIYGEVPSLGTAQPLIDTLKITITN